MHLRLDKFLCDALQITRTEAKKKLAAGRVKLDGVLTKNGSLKIDTEKNEICVDEMVIHYTQYVYLMFHKPPDCVCANSDSTTTVFDLLPQNLFRKDLFCVGRLDKDTTGLLLITNDGNWAHKIISPKHKIKKVYRATLTDPFTAQMQKELQDGITLADGTVCLPAETEAVGEKEILITVFEGKYHQVKRMLAACGNKVASLHREQIGSLKLDSSLPLGEVRILSDSERENIFKNDK